MSQKFETVLDLSIWILFIKGLLTIPVTFYVIGQALLGGNIPLIVGLVSCSVGTLAFAMACFAIWVRSRIQ